MNGLLQKAKESIGKHDEAMKAFNIGLNCGESAGQTVMHMHLIPRRDQDVPSPKGGIRNVIPGKGAY